MMKIRLLVALLTSALVLPLSGHSAFAVASPSPGSGGTASPDQQVQEAQAKLAQLNDQVERANGELDNLNRKLNDDKQRESELNLQLTELARLQYQQPVLTVTTVLGAQSLDQLLGDIAQARLVARKQQDLLGQAGKLREQDQKARDDMARQLASIKEARQQASQILDKAIGLRDSQLQKRAQSIIAPAPPPAPGQWVNHFFYGQCTWYVASKRFVPWFGNAIEWYANAQQYSFAEGQAPKVGAIMVTSESGYGHVALVEAVYPDGSWKVSEMNYQGWGMVDYRTIRPGGVPLIGFIY
jgi:surface antigen